MKTHRPGILACIMLIVSILSGCTAKPAQIIPAITAGIFHTCALNSDGEMKCWGGNEYGQLGDGTTTQRLTPVAVVGLTSKVIAISAGGYHTCALISTGAVKCWGKNNFGQLGDGTTTHQINPVDVSELPKRIKSIAAGINHTCAVTSKGNVKCWGDNQAGALGNGMYKYGGQLTPVDVVELSRGVVAIDAADGLTCALIESGKIKCWGSRFFGGLGDGTSDFSYTPIDVSGVSNAIAISAGDYHVCALTSDSGVKCWGNNSFGGIGTGTLDQTSLFDPNFLTNAIYPIPVDVRDLTSGVRAIATGERHTCALTSEGNVKCWGANDAGQLGDGNVLPMPPFTTATPVDVVGLSGSVSTLTAGAYHTCALLQDGAIQCWGSNGVGQLGDGTTTPQLTPVGVIVQ